MQAVPGLRDLKNCTEKYVYVSSYKRVYKRVGNDYVEKRYFYSGEVAAMLGIRLDALSRLLKRGNIRTSIRVSLKDFQQLKNTYENR